MMGHYKRLIREDMAHHIPYHVRKKEKKVGFAHPWDSRGYDNNATIGEEDWEIQQEQLVDFKDKLKDNG